MKTKKTLILAIPIALSALQTNATFLNEEHPNIYDKFIKIKTNLNNSFIEEIILDLKIFLNKEEKKELTKKTHNLTIFKIKADIYFLNDLRNHLQNPTQESATKLKNWALTSSAYAEIVQNALKPHL